MNRCLGYAMLVALGIMLGVAATSHQQTQADPPSMDPAARAIADTNASALAELKEIKTQLKEINSFLKTGVIKTITTSVMNPDLR